MKRMLFAATAIIALGAPMAAPAFADQPQRYGGYDRDDRNDRNDRRYDRDHRSDRLHNKSWKVGDRYYRDARHYREVDYRDYRMKAPPRGYHYVRDNNTGDIILAAIATGLIAAIIAN